MRLVLAFVIVAGVVMGSAGCVDQGPCSVGPTNETAGSQAEAAAPYCGKGNPYDAGELSVRTIRLTRCQFGTPKPLLVYTPESPGSYAVVVLQHGFMIRNECYGELMQHLASQGFVVVAPQMYEPGLCALLGNPTAAEEAADAAAVLEWVHVSLADVVGVQVRTDLLGLVGHSRGGKVAWLLLSGDPGRAKAIAGIDPVDGTGGPTSYQPRVVQGPFSYAAPSLVIGSGLGGSCAPEGDNHVQFYGAVPSPAWHVVAVNQGHGDMLDEGCAAAASLVCASGADRAGMRRLTAGLLTAFFRAALQGDASAYAWLTDTAAPIPVSVESK